MTFDEPSPWPGEHLERDVYAGCGKSAPTLQRSGIIARAPSRASIARKNKSNISQPSAPSNGSTRKLRRNSANPPGDLATVAAPAQFSDFALSFRLSPAKPVARAAAKAATGTLGEKSHASRQGMLGAGQAPHHDFRCE